MSSPLGRSGFPTASIASVRIVLCFPALLAATMKEALHRLPDTVATEEITVVVAVEEHRCHSCCGMLPWNNSFAALVASFLWPR